MTALTLFTNRATAKIAADVSSGDTAITLVAGGGDWFPSPAANQSFRLVLQKGSGQTDQREYMICTGRAGDVLTVTRAQEGTPAANFTTGDEVSLVATAATLTQMVQRIGATLQGALEVEADPTTPLGIATRQMVQAGAFPEAPDDANIYGRGNKAWMTLGDAARLSVPIPITAGGTSATSLAGAQTNLGIAKTTFDDLAPATPNYGDRWIKPSNMTEMVWAPNAGGGGAGIWINPADAASEAYPLAIAKGGTGATDAPTARINLGISNATGQWILGDGTVAAPGLAWANEPGLGFYRPANNALGIAVAGSRTLSLDASQAASTYFAILARSTASAVSLSAGANPTIFLDKVAGTNSNDIIGRSALKSRWLFRMGNETAETGSNAGSDLTLFRYDDTGATASGVLTIYRNNGDGYYLGGWYATRYGLDQNAYTRQDANAVYQSFAAGWFWSYDKATGQLIWAGGGRPNTVFLPNGDFYAGRNLFAGTNAEFGLIKISGYNYLRFSTDDWRLQFNQANGALAYCQPNGTVLFNVDGGGNFSAAGNINTTNGQIVVGNGPSMFYDGNRFNYVRMQNGGNASATWSWAWDRSTGELRWLGGSSQILVSINGSGGAIFNAPMVVYGSLQLRNADGIHFADNNGADRCLIQDIGNGTMRINASGHLTDFQSDGNFVIQSGGSATKPGGGPFSVLSDITVKRDVQPYTRGLEDILAYQPVSYRYIGDDEKTYIGQVAQEVEPIDASMVFEDMQGLKNLDTTADVYKLINAVKTLHQRLKQLEMQ